jgi:E3 ubiquitin-protein ligase RAD18
MTVAEVQAHIDHCTGEPPRPKRATTSKKISIPTPILPLKCINREERLSPLNYSMLNDSQLRRKLTDQGISAAGSRQLMQRRYTEWITLWNANCDAKDPKGKNELKRELDVWERTQGGRAPLLNAGQNSGAQIRDKDFDGIAWASKHDDSFRDLIAKARQKRSVKPPTLELASNQSDLATEQSHREEAPSISLPSTALDTEMIEGDAKTLAQPPALPEGNLRTQSSRQGQGESSPIKYSESKNRFFEEDTVLNSTLDISARPTSSQYRNTTSNLDMDNGLGSDMGTIRPLQP